MQVTKYGHSCVRFDDGDRSLVVDPGAFSDVEAAMDGVGGVLITHEHMDHVNVEKVRSAVAADSGLRVHAPQPVLDSIGDLGDQGIAVHGGESLMVAGFDVQTFGDQHAVIHPLVPVVANVGYFVGGSVYHPGDSLVVPPFDVELLLLPAMAPWAKISEIIDYAVAARAPKIRPIHDFMVKEVYFGVLVNSLKPIIGRFGLTYEAFDQPVSV